MFTRLTLDLRSFEKGIHCRTLCSVWNGFDLRTGEGVKQAIKVIHEKKTRFLWIATECGAFSPIQNCNQRTPEQQEALKQKQVDARKQHVGALVVAHWAHAAGSVVCWEWSRRCRAWKWDLLDEWRNHCNTSTAIISGCQVGLKDPKAGVPLGKEWRVECTDRRLSERLHNTCACLNKTHALCEGQAARMTAFYTPEFVRRVVYHMLIRTFMFCERASAKRKHTLTNDSKDVGVNVFTKSRKN